MFDRYEKQVRAITDYSKLETSSYPGKGSFVSHHIVKLTHLHTFNQIEASGPTMEEAFGKLLEKLQHAN